MGRLRIRHAFIFSVLALLACTNHADNGLSPEMKRLLTTNFSSGVGYVAGMSPFVAMDFAWCGYSDIADLMVAGMQKAVDRSVCISDQNKRKARDWLITFTSTLKTDVRRYTDAHDGLPERAPWPNSPLCKNMQDDKAQFRTQLTQYLATAGQPGRTEACHPVPGP